MTRPSSPNDGDSQPSAKNLYEQVYHELRALAHSQMSREYMYSTLQGTALVHEAWLRLGAENQPEWKNKRHLFAAASEAMRRILIERARKRSRKKNGGEYKRVSHEHILTVGDDIEIDDHLIRIGEALEKFAAIQPRKAELVRLRYFFGLSFEEAAKTMEISLSTTKRWWIYSRSWLHRELSKE